MGVDNVIQSWYEIRYLDKFDVQWDCSNLPAWKIISVGFLHLRIFIFFSFMGEILIKNFN